MSGRPGVSASKFEVLLPMLEKIDEPVTNTLISLSHSLSSDGNFISFLAVMSVQSTKSQDALRIIQLMFKHLPLQ